MKALVSPVGTGQYCDLVYVVTQFRPMACTHFEMRY